MKEDLPMSETVKISITSNPFPKVGLTAFPMPGLSLKAEIEAFLEMETEVSRAKLVDGNVNES
jgi:hypothetical protein